MHDERSRYFHSYILFDLEHDRFVSQHNFPYYPIGQLDIKNCNANQLTNH